MAEQTWVVRAGRGGIYAQDFLKRSIVAVGWKRLGDLSAISSREQIVSLVEEKYPEFTKTQRIVSVRQVYSFRIDLKPGSNVVTYDPATRLYHLGSVTGDYVYQANLEEEYRNTRKVTWKRAVSRDSLTASTKNRLGSIATIFTVSESAATELLDSPAGARTQPDLPPQAEAAEAEAEVEIRKDTEQRALEFLQDKLNQLDWSQMQELVGGLLRAMGYKTRISPAGPDRGRDILASPDGFGFQPPRILVEVKHRIGAIGAPAIRSFVGGLRAGDNGLYVSTGGFTKEARYEADRANHPLTLMDSNDLGEAIIEHYDQMDLEARTLLPLKKIYWPV